MGIFENRVDGVRVEMEIFRAIEATSTAHNTTLSFVIRRALIVWCRMVAVERERMFALEITRALAEMRRVGGLYALCLKQRRSLPPELSQELSDAIKSVKAAAERGASCPANTDNTGK